jgi:hypothetical protein
MALTKNELAAKVEEQGHLAEAVRAKDLEIAQFKKEIELLKKNLSEVEIKANAKIHELEVQLKARLQEVETQANGRVQKAEVQLAEKVSEIKKQKQVELESVYKGEIDNLKNVVSQYQEANKKLVANANRHVTVFRNLVNVVNGALNMATEIDELISSKKE